MKLGKSRKIEKWEIIIEKLKIDVSKPVNFVTANQINKSCFNLKLNKNGIFVSLHLLLELSKLPLLLYIVIVHKLTY